jgi:hypothetical protein
VGALTEANARPLRSYLRFGVRGLIVAVLLLGAGFGWIVRGARIQRDAVAAIRRAGGSVTYAYERKFREKAGPRWLVEAIGVDYLDHVHHVALTEKATDKMMTSIGDLSQLEELSLGGSSVTDPGLAHLHGLRSLRWLSLSTTGITDEGLRHIAGLSNLTDLNLISSEFEIRILTTIYIDDIL